MQLKIATLIKFIEQALLVLIAILTILATGEEVVKIYFAFSVQLADLLLLFIYTEVLGMIGIYFIINRIPITLPIFIAMTAISRLIVLQGKEMDMSLLLYEAAAILVLAIAVMVVRYKPVRTYNYHTDEE
jgi:protein PsiE